MSENDNKNINNEENTNVNENNGQTTETQNDGHVQNVVDNIKLIIASVLVIVALSAISTLLYLLVTTCTFGHKWQPANCVTPQICEKCKQTKGAPLGHNWIAATCTKPKTCSRCNETEGEPIAHKIENTNVTKKPTCSETGEKVGVCSICHQTITQTIPATGHKAGEWEMYTEPTIDSAGEKVQKCTVCGAIVNRWSVHLTPEEIYERYYPITLVSLSKRNISSYNECHYSIQYRVDNNSSTDINSITVKATLCDSSGKEVTSNTGYIFNLPASQSKERTMFISDSRDYLRLKSLEVVNVD